MNSYSVIVGDIILFVREKGLFSKFTEDEIFEKVELKAKKHLGEKFKEEELRNFIRKKLKILCEKNILTKTESFYFVPYNFTPR